MNVDQLVIRLAQASEFELPDVMLSVLRSLWNSKLINAAEHEEYRQMIIAGSQHCLAVAVMLVPEQRWGWNLQDLGDQASPFTRYEARLRLAGGEKNALGRTAAGTFMAACLRVRLNA